MKNNEFMDIQKQIDFWVKSAEEDFAAAQSLVDKDHFRHSLFFAHLAIEKMLKAHVVNRTKDVPPKVHDIVRLAQLGGINLSKEQKNLLLEFRVYQLEGRYPDSQQLPLSTAFVKNEIARAKGIIEWLKAQL